MSQGPSSGKRGAGASLKGRNLVPISLELYNECRSRSKALEASGRKFDPSNPVMERCPYDKCHVVAAHKMSSHLEKCRLNYVEKMTAKGYKGARMTCKYNIRHQVLAPEKTYHEDHCDDRHYVPFYLLYVNPYFQDEEKKFRPNLEELKTMDPVELEKMHEGLFLNTVIGGDNLTLLPVLVEDVLNPEAAKERAKKAGEREKAKQAQAKVAAQLQGAVGGAGPPEAEMDEEERWWNESNGKKFDYMESVNNPKGPLWYKYPPGLSKARRREFDKWNTQWMADILANAPKEDIPTVEEPPQNLDVVYDLVVLDDYDFAPSLGVADDFKTYAQAVKGSDLDGVDTTAGISTFNAGTDTSNAGPDADATKGTSTEGTVPVAYTGEEDGSKSG